MKTLFRKTILFALIAALGLAAMPFSSSQREQTINSSAIHRANPHGAIGACLAAGTAHLRTDGAHG